MTQPRADHVTNYPHKTPARSDSVKKPKIKLTSSSTPKTNGAAPAKPAKTAEPKAAKPKAKKAKEAEEKKAEKEPATPKEPKLTPEEKHQRKEVRHSVLV